VGPLPGHRSETISAEDATDRAGRDPDAELSQLTFYAHTSPASILPAETNDQLDELVAHRGSPRASPFSPASPPAPGEFPVPAHDGVGGDEEASPTPPREQSTERGEDRPVDGPVADTSVELSLEDPNLVAEHHDLELLVRLGPSP
jgi:hypothetical protein